MEISDSYGQNKLSLISTTFINFYENISLSLNIFFLLEDYTLAWMCMLLYATGD